MPHILKLSGLRPTVEREPDDRRYPHMISFEQLDGTIESFSHLDLRSLGFEPPGTVIVRFTTGTVVMTGRNLEPVRQAVRDRRARHLRVGSDAEGHARADHEPHIETMTVTDMALQE